MFVQSENVLLNRNVFGCFLNKLRQSVEHMASGRLFQWRGAALEIDVWLGWVCRTFWATDWRV